jgi:branched-chain amino acid transport system ATP-binding protein
VLTLQSIVAGYGDVTVLRNIDFTVAEGEVVALLGPNGAGKTTLLRAASGFVKVRSGRIEFCGQDMTHKPPHAYSRAGICHLPEGRGIFPSLSVHENLVIQARTRHLQDAVDEAVALFPVLGQRLKQTAGSLSGGEQQMLALSRAYIARPRVVLVDEASLGLAPLIVDAIYDSLAQLKSQGVTVVLVEQYVHKALELADRVYILSRGEVVFEGAASALDTTDIYERYLGIEAINAPSPG